MTDKEKLQERTDTGEALIMHGEAIKNHAAKADMTQAKICLKAAKICAPELIRECEVAVT